MLRELVLLMMFLLLFLPMTSGMQFCLHYFLSMLPWANFFTSCILSFFVCKGGITKLSATDWELFQDKMGKWKTPPCLAFCRSSTNITCPSHSFLPVCFTTLWIRFLTNVYIATLPRLSNILKWERWYNISSLGKCWVGSGLTQKLFLDSWS